jgi:thiol-disulfide isomerase/thioredoxin
VKQRAVFLTAGIGSQGKPDPKSAAALPAKGISAENARERRSTTMKRTMILLLAAAVAAAACGKRENPSAKTTSPAPPAKAAANPAPAPAPPAGEAAVGAAMPAYAGDTLDGKKFSIASERGSVLFLNLWATWCGPCRFEIPELEALHTKYAGRNFKVVGVSLDDSGADAVRQFVTDHKMTYPIVLDPNGNLANIFQTSVIPTSAIVDRNGKIVWKHYGVVTTSDPELVRALEKALGTKG